MNNANEEHDDDRTPVYGCEFCGYGFNRPDGNEPFVCPYCGQRWVGAAAVDEPDAPQSGMGDTESNG